VQPLGRVQSAVRGLTAGELAAIVLGQVHAPLALILLPHEIGDQLADELTAGLPQVAQLIEHQRRVGRSRRRPGASRAY